MFLGTLKQNHKGVIMAIVLNNGKIKLKIETAGEKYQGSRFDWNGAIVSAKFDGIETLGEEKTFGKRNPRLYGRGMHNEFGIRRPVGFDDCGRENLFPKIGTGWLYKEEGPYRFHLLYALIMLDYTTTVDTANNKATFHCHSVEINGYAFEYTKQIELNDSGFSVSYTLKNTGSKLIETDEYVHNFIKINHKKISQDQELTFSWNINKDKLLENVDPCNSLLIEGNSIKFANTPKKGKEFFLAGLTEGISEAEKANPSWTLTDNKNHIQITEKTDFCVSRVDLWGHAENISPEMFYSFSIKPGETTTWKRTIEYKKLGAN